MLYLKTILRTGVAVFAIGASAFSAPAGAESLSAAVAAALNHHPSVEAAMAARDAAREEYSEYRAGYFPQLDVRSAAGRMYSDNSTSRGLSVTRGAGYSGLWEGSATLTQLLFDGWETRSRVEAAQARKESANLEIVDVREQLAMRAIMAYLDVLRGREALAALDEHRLLVDSYIERIGNMVNEGAADESMLVQARDIGMQLLDTRASLEGRLRTGEAAYAEITGHAPGGEMGRPLLAADSVPEDADAAVAMAQEVHPLLRAADYSEEAFAHEIEAERAKFTPAFNGEVSYLKRDQRDLIGGEVLDARALVRMKWSFSVGGAQRARLRKAEYKRVESQAQREETLRSVEKMIRVAYSDRETAAGQLKVLQQRVALNRDLLENYKAQFEAARVNLLQLMQTENTLFNARLSRTNGEFRYLAAQYAILASMGILQESLSLSTMDAEKKAPVPEAPAVDERMAGGVAEAGNEEDVPRHAPRPGPLLTGPWPAMEPAAGDEAEVIF